jgi:hypothetical protein
MNNTVFKKVFPIDDYDGAILIAIHERDNMFNYTVADADGDGGYEETLVPFIESKYKYDSIEEAFENAKCAYAEYAYDGRLNAYNKECEKYEKDLNEGRITQAEYDHYMMLLADKYEV